MVLLTKTEPEVYITTMISAMSNSYASLVETPNHMKSVKIKDRPEDNVVDFCDTILVDAERLETDGYFKPKHLRYNIHISEDTSDSKFHLRETQKYKKFM